MTSATARRRLPTAAPDGLLAAVMLGLLGTAGMFYINLMPAIVSGLKDALGFTNAEAGHVASANAFGAAAGALAAVFLVRHVAWKRAQAAALSLLILADLLSILVKTPGALAGLRALHGLCGGTSIGIALAIMARTRVPQRAFGAQFTLQILLGGLGLMWLPELAQRLGAPVLFLTLASLAVVTLAVLPFLDEYPAAAPPTASVDSGGGAIALGPLVATLFAIYLFQTANMALFAFVIPLGRQYGLATGFIENTLGFANWVAAAGSIFAMWAGDRLGRRGPVAIALALTIAGTLAFLRSDVGTVFIAANVVTGIVWSFLIPYLFSMCAGFDRSGRSATLGGFFSKMGLASGPLLAPLLIGTEGYSLLIFGSAVALLLCGIAAAWPAIRLDAARLPGGR
jgi:predicted MFS family arabinose efflux permease